MVAGALGQARSGSLGGDRPFEPALSRHAHLGPQPQQVGCFERLDAERVDRVADPELARMAPAATRAHAPDREVDEPP